MALARKLMTFLSPLLLLAPLALAACVAPDSGDKEDVGVSRAEMVRRPSCTSDGYCITALTTSASSAAGGTTVTITAKVNLDIAPTPYYLLIVDDTTGAVLAGTGGGTTLSASVTSPDGTTRNYHAVISTQGA